MTEPREYWTHLEEREGAPPAPASASGHAAAGHPRVDLTRRGFLAAVGFTVAGAASGCGRAEPTVTATPPSRPEDVTPGRATWYASTCGGCEAGCGVLVKCVDGRPIKLEGLPAHPLSAGGLCATGQAQVLSLYDSRRLLAPRGRGGALAWEAVDARVREALAAADRASAPIRLLTGTVHGPSARGWIEAFLQAHPGARHVAYDPLSWSASSQAHEATHGVRALPRWRLESCRELLCIDADPLGAGPSPVEHMRQWRAARDLEATPPRWMHHEQVESALTLTGSNADRRHRLAPWQVPSFVGHLAAVLAARAGLSAPAPQGDPPLGSATFTALVDRLWAARGAALVLCGSQDPGVQALVNRANEALGAYGATLDLEAPSRQRLGDDRAFAALLAEAPGLEGAVWIVAGVDPLADAPGRAVLEAAFARAALTVAFATHENATTRRAELALPVPHALEAWDDGEPVAGLFGMTQPVLRPLGSPRSLRAALAAWLGGPASERELARVGFERYVAPRLLEAGRGFDGVVHDGFARLRPEATPRVERASAALAPAPALPAPGPGALALVAVAQVGMLDGRHAHNPWLHELPDPITKQVWGNAAQLAPRTADDLGLADGDLVRLEGGGSAVELPVLRQPGLAERTVVVARGYGRLGTDRFADVGPSWLEGERTVEPGGTIGAAVEGFVGLTGEGARAPAAMVTPRRLGRRVELARTQVQHTQDLPAHLAPPRGAKREMVREVGRTDVGGTGGDAHGAAHAAGHGAVLWDKVAAEGERRWGLVIDLSACTGCSACVVACQAENNVPVVGRDEVLRRRDMAWVRIDRYYADAPGRPGDVDVVHQPMLCHHCGNAPCESVCPVLATTHSSDGLNEQVYNRCVGTRYCANNCPFKVRRFNWFEYDRADPWADLALNPDVTVRSRGVMEKCSLCVQRIAEARAVAKVAGRPLAEGDVRTACQQSCPSGAIVFGDRNDPGSAVSKAGREKRSYALLDELNLKSAVAYQARVRDDPRTGGGRHG
jgi:molybdopterin-containing oxidoreductase family iron-sulfur binding subunit